MRRSYKILITGVVILIAGFSIQWILPRLMIEDENFLTAVRTYEPDKFKSFDDFMNSPLLKEYLVILLIMVISVAMPYVGGVVLAVGTAIFFLDKRKKPELIPKPKQAEPRKVINCVGIVLYIFGGFGIWDLKNYLQNPDAVVSQNQLFEMALDLAIMPVAFLAATLLLKLNKWGVILAFAVLGLSTLDAVIFEYTTSQLAIVAPIFWTYLVFLLYKNWKVLNQIQGIRGKGVSNLSH